jgi:hypothetical protein
MIIQITGDTGGVEPYDIFLCDPTNTSCFYVSGLTNIPATVEINTDNYFPDEVVLYIKIIDVNGCTYTKEINCEGQKAFQDFIYFNFMDGVGYYFQ